MIDIQEHLPLAPFTYIHIGGPARFFATAASLDELREALLFARGNRLSFAILGGGSNLLVSDRGFDGLIIRLNLEEVVVSGEHVTAGAGADLTGLVLATAERGLGGMESLAGIPGLLGGAVRGNAGAYGSCIGELVVTVQALDAKSLELLTLSREECVFGYRQSRFKREPQLIVVSALLALSPGDAAEIRSKAEGTIARRIARKLQCEKSVGSFFMNPVVTDGELIRRFENDRRTRCRDGRIPAGWLIDQAGLRGSRVGSAMVSAQHANYLINTGEASADEMLRLADLVKCGVQAALGVRLQEEVSLLGFPAVAVQGRPTPESSSPAAPDPGPES